MRQCPTLEGDARALITHTISVDLCMSRQRCHYHKCHRCLYRGKPASHVVEDGGFARGTVEVDAVRDLSWATTASGTNGTTRE